MKAQVWVLKWLGLGRAAAAVSKKTDLILARASAAMLLRRSTSGSPVILR